MLRLEIPRFVNRMEKKIGDILTRFQEGLMLDTEAQTFSGPKTFTQLQTTVAATLTPADGATPTQEIDWENGNIQVIDMDLITTADLVTTMVNPVAGATYLLIVIQGAGVKDLVLPATVLFPGGSAPATINVTATDVAIDTIEMFFDGTNYLARLVQAYA